MKYAALLIAAACAQPRPIPPPPSRDWPLAKVFEAYLAADERLALRIDAPAGGDQERCGDSDPEEVPHLLLRRVSSAEVGRGARPVEADTIDCQLRGEV